MSKFPRAALAMAVLLGACASAEPVSKVEVAAAKQQFLLPYLEKRAVVADRLGIEISANFDGEVARPAVHPELHSFSRTTENGDDVYRWGSRGGPQSPLRFRIGNTDLVALKTATLRVRGSGKAYALTTVAAGSVTELAGGAESRSFAEIRVEEGLFRTR